MNDMIKGLLAYATAAENSDLTQSRADSNEVMQQVMTNLEIAIVESGADVYCGLLPVVRIENIHLVQLLQNLVANALKYRRKAVAPVIRISAARDGDLWIFQVRDNGIGFNPDYNDLIFKLFKRLHGKDEYPGTGIGLAICARIVAHYRGRIWADGYPGEAAVFSFTLPGCLKVRDGRRTRKCRSRIYC